LKSIISAMSTPLASIFGSGFLVIVPILAGAVGQYSVIAMGFICLLAYFVGEVIRYNIKYVEPELSKGASNKTLVLEKVSDVSLILAYVISVCLYLHILSAFVLNGIGQDTPFNESLLTSVIILLITAIGLFKGLNSLEGLEKWALGITLLIIVILCFSFFNYDASLLSTASMFKYPTASDYSVWEVTTILGGALIVVQGFETSRYLGHVYDAETRIKSSRYSQYLSAAIYIIFVSLALPIVHQLNGNYNDHSLIELVGIVSAVLITPLILAATLSQFSAAVADTIAASGNMVEIGKGVVTEKQGYLLVGIGAFILTWTVNTFEVLALASRAFALYYLLQCFVAYSITKSLLKRCLLILISIVLGFITVFAVPVG